MASLSQNAPWLLDTLLDIHSVQKRWVLTESSSSLSIIETVLDISSGLDTSSDIALTLKIKSHALVVLLCSDLVSSPQALLQSDDSGDRARRIYCRALLTISRAASGSYSTGRMAASKLVQELTLLSSQYSSIGEGSDIWVGNASPSG